MIIIGADYHPGFQQIVFVDTDTGDLCNWQTQVNTFIRHYHTKFVSSLR
jgi:hypothetical protein